MNGASSSVIQNHRGFLSPVSPGSHPVVMGHRPMVTWWGFPQSWSHGGSPLLGRPYSGGRETLKPSSDNSGYPHVSWLPGPGGLKSHHPGWPSWLTPDAKRAAKSWSRSGGDVERRSVMSWAQLFTCTSYKLSLLIFNDNQGITSTVIIH